MGINLISLATVKSQLGISVTTYDSALTALIPIVSSDVRRILNDSFNKQVPATVTSGSNIVSIGDYYQIMRYELGQIITGSGIPADTYLSDFDYDNSQYTMSANATASMTYVVPTIKIAQWPAISKMIWYKYSKQNTSSAESRGVTSESYGPVSINYSDKEINKQYDYPQVLLDDLGIPNIKVG